MEITRLDHVVFAVQDLAAAVHDWHATFGLEAGASIKPAGTRMELIPLPVGDAFLELITVSVPAASASEPEQRIAGSIKERAGGMLSLALEVSDLDASVRELRAKGVAIDDPAPGLLPDSRVARIARDVSHGVPMQLIERTR